MKKILVLTMALAVMTAGSGIAASSDSNNNGAKDNSNGSSGPVVIPSPSILPPNDTVVPGLVPSQEAKVDPIGVEEPDNNDPVKEDPLPSIDPVIHPIVDPVNPGNGSGKVGQGGSSGNVGGGNAGAVTGSAPISILSSGAIFHLNDGTAHLRACHVNGTLLRNSAGGQIFKVVNNSLSPIRDLKELAQYKGKEIINISPLLAENYRMAVPADFQVKQDPCMPSGTLVRDSSTMRIYSVNRGALSPIRTLEELAKYKGKAIINLAPESIIKYGYIEQLSQIGAYANQSLLRDVQTGRIYVMEEGKARHIKTLTELARYAGKTINNVTPAVIASL
ncbi:MAG: hypothetical protein QY321_01105 [Patescibacteria group bacterium]|nr:MAG: hypothetical protein QY321_01105 [Patescibacteria group bacterium]